MRYFIIFLSLVLALCTTCNRPVSTPNSHGAAIGATITESTENQIDTINEKPAPSSDSIDATVKEQEHKSVQKAASKTAAGTTSRNEKLYVTGYTSNGQVWGYVTMKGDRGTGTIHDSEENHFSVTCTRHGDELYAVDHNSRQYVLKYQR